MSDSNPHAPDAPGWWWHGDDVVRVWRDGAGGLWVECDLSDDPRTDPHDPAWGGRCLRPLDVEAAVQADREAVVAWLRGRATARGVLSMHPEVSVRRDVRAATRRLDADAIEAGAHLTGTAGTTPARDRRARHGGDDG